MRKLLAITLAAALCTLAASADMIDQDQPSGPTYMAAFSQTDLAQSFQQEHDNITGAGILLWTTGDTDNVTISLWDALPTDGGNMLATASAMGTQGQWVDVFWGITAITPGTTYYLVFDGNTTLGIAGDTSNPYPYGYVYANPGYQPFPDFDYAFRTWYDETTATGHGTWSEVKALY